METIRTYLFPMPNIIFFPCISMPLHIFEPRYQKMVQDSIVTENPIALCLSNDIPVIGPTSDKNYKETAAKLTKEKTVTGIGIPKILKKYPDGTMDIMLKGVGKAVLLEIVKSNPYAICRARILENDLEMKSENQFKLNRLKLLLTEWLKKEVANPHYVETMLEFLTKPCHIVEASASNLIEDAALRQMILETDDINHRLDMILKILEFDAEFLHQIA